MPFRIHKERILDSNATILVVIKTSLEKVDSKPTFIYIMDPNLIDVLSIVAGSHSLKDLTLKFTLEYIQMKNHSYVRCVGRRSQLKETWRTMKEDTLNKSLLNVPTVNRPSTERILLLSMSQYAKKKTNASLKIWWFSERSTKKRRYN